MISSVVWKYGAKHYLPVDGATYANVVTRPHVEKPATQSLGASRRTAARSTSFSVKRGERRRRQWRRRRRRRGEGKQHFKETRGVPLRVSQPFSRAKQKRMIPDVCRLFCFFSVVVRVCAALSVCFDGFFFASAGKINKDGAFPWMNSMSVRNEPGKI